MKPPHEFVGAIVATMPDRRTGGAWAAHVSESAIQLWRVAADGLALVHEIDSRGALQDDSDDLGWFRYGVASGAQVGPHPVVLLGTDHGMIHPWRIHDDRLHALPPVWHGDRREDLTDVTALRILTHPDGSRLVLSGAVDGTVQAWRLSGDGLEALGPPTQAHPWFAMVGALALDDGVFVLTGGSTGALRAWWLDGSTLQLIAEAERAHTSPVNAMDLVSSPDGGVMVCTGANDGTVCLWSLTGDDGLQLEARAVLGSSPVALFALPTFEALAWCRAGLAILGLGFQSADA